MCGNAIGPVLPVTVLRTTRCKSSPNGDRILTELYDFDLWLSLLSHPLKGTDQSILNALIPDAGYGRSSPTLLPPQKKMQQFANCSIATQNPDNHKLHFYSLSPIRQSQRNTLVLPYDKKRGLPQCGSPPSYE